MAVKVDLTPSPHPLPLSAAERGRGPGGRGEVESNIVEVITTKDDFGTCPCKPFVSLVVSFSDRL